MLISLERGHGHQKLSGTHFMALTSISWLCVSLSQRSEKECGRNKRADERLLLFLSWLDWHPAAFLLPDHLGYCDEISPFFFCICCLAGAFESLKHNEWKKSREAGKVVLIVFSFFFPWCSHLCHMYKEYVKFNIGWGQKFCTSHTYTSFSKLHFFSRKVIVLQLQWSMGIKKGKFSRETVIPFITLTDRVEKKHAFRPRVPL